MRAVQSETSLKLHLGCGSKFIPGFKHADLAEFDHVDYQRDVRDLSCFGDNSADLIYACHVLEYFDLQEAVGVLKEWQRVLKPGGILRLAVPHFEALTRVYCQAGALAKILGPLYGRMSMGNKIIYHRTVYDFESLTYLLRVVGFRGIHCWDWRETEHSEVDDCSQAYWPHMDKENGILISLNVEAQKA